MRKNDKAREEHLAKMQRVIYEIEQYQNKEIIVSDY